MKSLLDHALELAERGFHVFPIIPNTKLPLIDDFPDRATRDEAQIRRWWTDPVLGTTRDYNIGISSTRYGESEALVIVDIDVKKDGFSSALELELQGYDLPPTLRTNTPTGGAHLIYICPAPLGQGTDVLGRGLDIRSGGGYVVGPGSILEGRTYGFEDGSVSPAGAPDWVTFQCGLVRSKQKTEETPAEVDSERANARARFYLEHEAPLAIEGAAGDQTTFAVAARIKDFGVEEVICLELLLEVWNTRCSPPWDTDSLKKKVANAYIYGKESPGSAAPETQFGVIEGDENLHPFEKLNREFAFVLAGGGHHVLWETKDVQGRYRLEHLSETSFHKKFASFKMMAGDGKTRPVTELWMQDKGRRSYNGMCFRPGNGVPPEWYNLWRGFSVAPAKEAKHDSLSMFLEHAKENVCGGDAKLFRWLIGYFAHLVQKPGEKPLVALVFRGSKGVGKNALIDRVGSLLGHHYLLTSNRRYLIGNFNGHLENCLLFALDEAFWSGDKQAEGTLKDLITGSHHVIEHKGKEPYTVDNCTRVVIIGNEDWLVPATQDERRFAVFHVGDERKNDRKFFHEMRVGMEQGGYAHLLRYLLDFDLEGVDLNEAPLTQALHDQKLATLEPFENWWLTCLSEGVIVQSDFATKWPEDVAKERFREAFYRHARNRNVRGRLPDERAIGRFLAKCAPSIQRDRKQREGEVYVKVYKFSALEQCRKEWERFIGHEVLWEKNEG